MRFAILLAPLLALLAACDGGEEPQPTPRPSPSVSRPSPTPEDTATPTPTVEATAIVQAEADGLEGFRAFAAQIEEAVASGDVEFFPGRAVTRPYTCTGQEEFVLACVGQTPGAIVETFRVGYLGSEGVFTTLADYSARLDDFFGTARPDVSDEFGDGTPFLHSVAVSLPPHYLGESPPEDGAPEIYQAILTGIVDPTGQEGPHRQARISNWLFIDGSWRLTSDAVAASSRWTADYLSGDCDDCYDRWERWEANR